MTRSNGRNLGPVLILLITGLAVSTGAYFVLQLPPAGFPLLHRSRSDRGGSQIRPTVFSETVVRPPSAAFPSDYAFPQIMRGGCALVDWDQDGDLDILSLNVVTAELSQLDWFQQTAPLRFERQALAEIAGQANGLTIGDVNNDGWPDVYVTCCGRDVLLLADRRAGCRDVTAESGLTNASWGASAALLDYDRDGWLDLYVANYVDYPPGTRCKDAAGSADFCNPNQLSPLPHKLFHNDSGAGQQSAGAAPLQFTDVSTQSGIASKTGPGLGVVAADFTGDGWMDLYVANDGAANFLWVNRQNGTFADEALVRGCAVDVAGKPQASMGLAVADFDGNGWWDVVSTHLIGENHALYSGSELGFEEASGRWGLAALSLPDTGFGTAAIDVELDGDLDLLVVNGKVRRPRSPLSRNNARGWGAYAEGIRLCIQSQSRQFIDAPETVPLTPWVARGLACGDLDNDGDVDGVIATANGGLIVLRNDALRSGHWISLRVLDPARGGRVAIGATLVVRAGQRTWRQAVCPNASYLSTHDSRVHFGLGAASRVDSIAVLWPDGSREFFPEATVDQFLTLKRGDGQGDEPVRSAAAPSPK